MESSRPDFSVIEADLRLTSGSVFLKDEYQSDCRPVNVAYAFALSEPTYPHPTPKQLVWPSERASLSPPSRPRPEICKAEVLTAYSKDLIQRSKLFRTFAGSGGKPCVGKGDLDNRPIPTAGRSSNFDTQDLRTCCLAISLRTQSVIWIGGGGGGGAGGLVRETGRHRMEVEMERGEEKKQDRVKMCRWVRMTWRSSWGYIAGHQLFTLLWRGASGCSVTPPHPIKLMM